VEGKTNATVHMVASYFRPLPRPSTERRAWHEIVEIVEIATRSTHSCALDTRARARA